MAVQRILTEEQQMQLKTKAIQGALFQTFQDRLTRVSPYLGVVNSLLLWPNYPGIKLFGEGLVTDGKITAQDYADLKAVLLSYGINVDA